MKYIKHLIGSFFIVLLILATGEMYRIAASEFPVDSQISVQLKSSQDSATFFKYAQKEAQRIGTKAFYYTLSAKDYSENEVISIFCSDESAKEFLIDTFGLKEGRVKSVFLGNAHLKYDQLKNCRTGGRLVSIFVVGTEESKSLFSEAIKKEYNVKSEDLHYEKLSFDNQKFVRFQFWGWTIACVFIFCVGLYEVSMEKKAMAIRYAHGERAFWLFCSKALTDSIIFIIVLVLAIAILSFFTAPMYSFKATLIGFAAFLLANVASQLPMMVVNIRRAFASDNQDNGLLVLSYAVKYFFCLIAALAGGVCFGVLGESIDIAANIAFFEQYKEYRYIDMTRSNIEDLGERLADGAKLAYRLTQASDDVLLQAIYSEYHGSDNNRHYVIVCGKSSLNYIQSVMPEVLEKPLEKGKMYIFAPNSNASDRDISQYVSLAYPSDGGAGYYFAGNYSKNDIQIIKYKKGVSFIAVDDNGAGKLCRDPVVIYSTVDEKLDLSRFVYKRINEHFATGGLATPNYCMLQAYKISDENLRSFATENDYDLDNDYFYSQNVYDKYLFAAKNVNSSLIIAILCLAVIMTVELMLVGTLVRMEYTVNAKRIAIKKMLGYTLLQSNRPIIIGTGAIYVTITWVALILNYYLELTDPIFVAIGCFITAAVEFIFMIKYIIKTDRTKTVKVLKGGAL